MQTTVTYIILSLIFMTELYLPISVAYSTDCLTDSPSTNESSKKCPVTSSQICE